jgi:hypothetical protein
MPKKLTDGRDIEGGKKSPFVQFRCPPDIRAWIEWYASVARGSNLTAIMISLIMREKDAWEEKISRYKQQDIEELKRLLGAPPTGDSRTPPRTQTNRLTTDQKL